MSIYGQSIFNEGFIDSIKSRRAARKELDEWVKKAKKVCKDITMKKSVNINEVEKLVEEWDKNSKLWNTLLTQSEKSTVSIMIRTLKNKLFENKKNVSKFSQQFSKEINIDPDKLVADIKKIEKELYSDPKYIEKVENMAQKAMKDYDLEEKDFKPSISGHPLVPKLIARYDGEEYIVVIDHGQMVRVGLSDILYDIIDKLVKLPEYKGYGFDIGDGDEGCIYW